MDDDKILRVKCRWNIGPYKSGTEAEFSEKDAHRLEALGAVSILRYIPGEGSSRVEEPKPEKPSVVIAKKSSGRAVKK